MTEAFVPELVAGTMARMEDRRSRNPVRLAKRVVGPRVRSWQRSRDRSWLERRSTDFAAFAAHADAELWGEAQRWSTDFEAAPKPPELEALAARGVGGAGHIRALYFLTRLLRPDSVVETGVSAGWSSAAFLEALDRNDSGHLWSSDLTYDRRGIGDFGDYNGCLVDERLRGRWSLFTDGDDLNLSLILEQVEHVDLLHYDSDKSYQGRERAFARLLPKLSPRSVVIVDDADDNRHFRDLTARVGWPFIVLEKDQKFVGLLAGPESGLPLARTGVNRSEPVPGRKSRPN